MMDISNSTLEQLKQLTTLREISEQVKSCIGNKIKAKDLASKLERKVTEVNLKIQAPKIYSVYQAWIYLLKFEALDLYSDGDVLNLIEKHCLEGLMFSPNFFRSLSIKMALTPLSFRDDYLEDLKDALKKNIQKIGIADITLTGETRPQPPLVKNWLRDYDDVIGIEYHDDVERSNYFVRSRNVRGLSDQDKETLRRLFYLYDLLKLKITDLGGLGSLPAATLGIEVTKAEEKPLKRFKPLFDPLDLVEKKAPSPPKPAIPTAPSKPPEEIEREIEAKRKEEERVARLEKEMRAKVAPPSKVKIPKPPVEPPLIKPAPEFKATRPPRIEAAPPSPKPAPPVGPKMPIKIKSLDDIKKLSVSDFRSYAELPKDSAYAIAEKINSLLSKASPLDKMKALSFWKESELYKLYIEMGRESMAQGISLEELAEKRKGEGKP